MIFEIILFGVSISLFVYWWRSQTVRNRKFNEKIKNIPGTNMTLPLIGDWILFVTKFSIHDKIQHFININSKYPSTLKIWMGLKLIIVLNNPEDIKTVLTSPYCLNKASVYHAAIGGNGLFVANGVKWKNQRRQLNPTFNTKVLYSYGHEFNRYGRNMVDALRELIHVCDEGKIDVGPIVGAHITDLITRTIYGSTHHTFELSKHCYELVERLMLLWGERTFNTFGYLILWILRKIFRIVSTEKQMNKELRSSLQPIFDRKLQEHNEKLKNLDNNKIDGRNEEIFLDKITRLQCEGAIGWCEYRHTIMTMFSAGIETTARNIPYILLMLAMHEDYQEKVYEEISSFYEIYGDGDIDTSKLSELNLLDRIVKETLRLFPVVPFMARTASRDIVIKDGIIPAGTDIGISFMNVHRHPLIWGANAHKFNPDNFLPENVAKREQCSFIPFSYGARNCIGYKFAQIASYIGIIYLIRNYKFKSPLKMEELKMGYGLTSFLMNDTKMMIYARNGR